MYPTFFPAVGVILGRSFTRSWQSTVWVCGGAVRDEAGGTYYGAVFARQYEGTLNAGLLAQAGEQRKGLVGLSNVLVNCTPIMNSKLHTAFWAMSRGTIQEGGVGDAVAVRILPMTSADMGAAGPCQDVTS